MEIEIGTLRFQCPKTDCEVDSGIDTDRRTLFSIGPFSVRVRCPLCEDLHEWQVFEGRLGKLRHRSVMAAKYKKAIRLGDSYQDRDRDAPYVVIARKDGPRLPARLP